MKLAQITQRYISEHPSIKDCVRKGLVNYSALAREICEEFQIEQFDAVLVACRRYYDRIKAQSPQENQILSLIRRAKVRLRNKMMVVIVERPRDYERVYQLQKEVRKDRGDFNVIEGEESLTIISNDEYLAEFREAFKGRIEKVSSDLAQLTMMFDEKIETTAGVVAFIYSLLSEHGINVREEMSCWTDLMMIIDERDAGRAMRALDLAKDRR